MFGTAQSSLLAFPEERPVFLREFSTDHYAAFTYFLARLTMEAFVTFIQIILTVFITYLMVGFQSSFGILLAICYALAMTSTALAVLLGCAVEDPKLGQEMLPILFVPQMLFAGFFVTPDLIPVWLRWAQYLCSLTYRVRLCWLRSLVIVVLIPKRFGTVKRRSPMWMQMQTILGGTGLFWFACSSPFASGLSSFSVSRPPSSIRFIRDNNLRRFIFICQYNLPY